MHPVSQSTGCVGAGMTAIKRLVLLAALAAGGWAAWTYGKPLWNKFRLNADVESASVFFMRPIPQNVASEAQLRANIEAAAQDKLKSHLAHKARWFVAFGTAGADLRVVRDDQFGKPERAFAERAVEDARKRGDPPGTQTQSLAYPLGALTMTVSVADAPWHVVVAWAEEAK
jgi:hypothetical protein